MKSKYNLIGSLGTFFSGDCSVLHINKYIELKNIDIPFELGMSLNTEAIKVIKTLTEGYAAVYMILDIINNKTYIGSTFGNEISSINRKLSEHKLKDLENKELYILKSYPVKELLALNDSSRINFLYKVIKEYEASLIINIKSEYNVNNTSETIKPTEESKSQIGAKISETHKESIGKKSGRPIKIILATKEELNFYSILEALDNNWISISERTLKRRLEDSKEFKTEKGIAVAVYAEKIDSSRIINDPNFLRIMKDISLVSDEIKLEALISIKIVYSKTNKRVTRERLEQAIKKYNSNN